MLDKSVMAVAFCAGNKSASCRPLMRSWFPPRDSKIMAGNSQWGYSENKRVSVRCVFLQ